MQVATIFEHLHDAVIDEVEQEGEQLRFFVEAGHLGHGEGNRYVVLIDRVKVFEWEPDEADDSIEGAEIQSTRDDGDVATIALDVGTLTLSGASVKLLDESGASLSVDELEKAANAYWESFSK